MILYNSGLYSTRSQIIQVWTQGDYKVPAGEGTPDVAGHARTRERAHRPAPGTHSRRLYIF